MNENSIFNGPLKELRENPHVQKLLDDFERVNNELVKYADENFDLKNQIKTLESEAEENPAIIAEYKKDWKEMDTQLTDFRYTFAAMAELVKYISPSLYSSQEKDHIIQELIEIVDRQELFS